MFINSFGVVTVAVVVSALLLLSLSLSRLLSLPYLFVLHVDYSSLARLDRGSMASLNLYLNEAAQLKIPLSLFSLFFTTCL